MTTIPEIHFAYLHPPGPHNDFPHIHASGWVVVNDQKWEVRAKFEPEEWNDEVKAGWEAAARRKIHTRLSAQ